MGGASVTSESGGEVEGGGLSRAGSLPSGTPRRRSGNGDNRGRTSQTAINGIVIGVGGAAVVYAAVSALMRR